MHGLVHTPSLSVVNDHDNSEQSTADAIREQLKRILSSPFVVATPQISRFLCFVVEEALNGRSAKLKQYTIAVEALGRSSDFNPQIDSIVRIEARRLRRALRDYYTTLGKNDPITIEIPTGSYKPVFRHREETNPLSLEADSEDSHQDIIPRAIPEPQVRPVVAVLALANLGKGELCADFADGLTEEILFVLTQDSGLPVMGPLSREQIRQEQLGPLEIGVHYGVRFVLDGSVRSQKGRIRIGIRLIDTTTGAHLWADTYEARLDKDDWFEIQKDLSLEIMAATVEVQGVNN